MHSPSRRRRRFACVLIALGCTLGGCTAGTTGDGTDESTTPAASTPTVATPAASAPAPTAVGAPTESAPPSSDDPVGTTGPPLADVSVIVANSGWDATAAAVDVGAYIDGIVEQGGICVLALSKDGTDVTAQAAAIADASTTGCGVLAVSGSALSPGTWRATISYTSATSAGISAAHDIEVP